VSAARSPALPHPYTGVDDLPHILTIIEVAAELRCSKAHVHNLINGKVRGVVPLPSLQLGRRRVVRRQSLLDWMHANEQACRSAMIRSSPAIDIADA
jgi:hypothetical protein